MSLGEFHTSNYTEHEFMPFVWVLFVLATFFTQITMLNMLIAIMGDTFDKVTENKKTFTTRTKLLILGDYTGNFLKQEKKNMFLFSINIDQEDQEDGFETWEGLIQRLRRFNTKQFDSLQEQLKSQISSMKEQFETTSKRDQAQDREDKEK